MEGWKEGRKEGRKEGTKEPRNQGTDERRNGCGVCSCATRPATGMVSVHNIMEHVSSCMVARSANQSMS